MRLLHIQGDAWGDDPLDISLCDFLGTDIPPYMILSHRWREEEILFSDMAASNRTIFRAQKGYEKLETSCRIALQQKLEYAWIDTCCIDKSSSAELSEAINSMYNYYAQAQVCYAYLDDVEQISLQEDGSSLASCAWFTRGWTLQELIAPRELYFYSMKWNPMGSKSSLCHKISEVSGISISVLRDPELLRQVCVSEKMSWAAQRSTTRPEDEAYALMGLFGVQMPPLYGEGRQNAFRRLQLEIMQTTADHTIFAWDSSTTTGDMLAPTVGNFRNGSRYERLQPDAYTNDFRLLKPDFNMTNFGLHVELPLWRVFVHEVNFYLALLACTVKETPWYIGIYLQKTGLGSVHRFHRAVYDDSTTFWFPSPSSIALPRISYGPIWISQKDYQPKPREFLVPKRRLDSVRFTVSSDTPQRLQQTHWYSGRQITELDSTWSSYMFEKLDRQLKFQINGSFVRSKINHEVVSLGEDDGFNVAFGIINDRVWVHLTYANRGPGERNETYEELFASYYFPTGRVWQKVTGEDPVYVPLDQVIYTTSLRRTCALRMYLSPYASGIYSLSLRLNRF